MDRPLWWQRGVVYQIYPRSFQDSNRDGIGDLRGIRSRLDYLVDLGVDAIWLSPIYPSPMADFGYDVADYCGVDRMFGSLADFDALLADAHARGLKVILDFVPNHTSDQHPWFAESRSGRASPRRDWYIWRDPAPGGGPPNNWRSFFGGPAWTFDVLTGQYYMHSFLPEQPELNWRSPDVRRAMLDAMRFWLDRGVDGFRVDVIWLMVKDELLRDNPPDPERPGELTPLYSADRPEVREVIGEMRAALDSYRERMMVGEIYLPVDRLVAYYDYGVHLPFNFQLIKLPWEAPAIRRAIAEYEAALPPGAWPNWVLGNHDQRRVATRVGAAQARVAAALLLTLRGTPTLYYGDELGMEDSAIPPEEFQDPQGKRIGVSRDPCRTPMQWDSGPAAGFSAGRPWLPLPPDYAARSVAAERGDPRSTLALHRRLLALRRAEPALSVGSMRLLPAEGDLVAFVREHAGRRLLAAHNLGGSPARLPLDAAGRVLLSSGLDREGEAAWGELALGPDESLVVELE